MEGDRTTTLEEAFQAFARFGLSKKNRDGLSLFNLDKWLRQANIVGKDVSCTTSAIIFKQLSKKRSLTINEFRTFLEKFAEARCISVSSLVKLLTTCGAPRLTKISDIGGQPCQSRCLWNPKIIRNNGQLIELGEENLVTRQSKLNCAIITEEIDENKKNIKINFASYHWKEEQLSPVSACNEINRESKAINKSKKRCSSEISAKDNCFKDETDKKKKKEHGSRHGSRSSHVNLKKQHSNSFQELVYDINYGIAPGIKLRNISKENSENSCCGDIPSGPSKFISGIINRKISGRDFTTSKESVGLKDGYKRRIYSSINRRPKKGFKNRINITEKPEIKLPVFCKSDLSKKECALLKKDVFNKYDNPESKTLKKAPASASAIDIREKNDDLSLPLRSKNIFEYSCSNGKLNTGNVEREPATSVAKADTSKHRSLKNGQQSSPQKKNLKVQFAEPIEFVA